MSEYTAYFRAQLIGDTEVLNKIREIERAIKQLEKYKNINLKANMDTSSATQQLDKLNSEAQALRNQVETRQTLNMDTSTALTGLEKVQSVLGGIGGVLEGLGSKLQSLGGIFGGNLMDMVGRRLVTMGTRSLVSGMQRSISRYDILHTFPMYAEAVGTDSERAAEMVQELNEAVLGLPTGLDEIVDSAKQYGILLDDLERGKELAISMNNALLASGASEAMQTSAEYEVFRLLTSGTLATSRQWRTLFQGLGAARQYIAKEMGYDDVTKWQNDLMGIAPNGATSEEKEAVKALATELQGEFIDALVKAGQGEGVMSLVEIYKSTLESSLANVKNAFANLGASVLDEIDIVLKEETGTGLVDTIVSFSDTIKQSFIPAVRDWIHENPDFITDFLDKLKNYDWGTLLTNIGEFAKTYFEFMSGLLSSIPPGATAFLMTLASPVGKGLSALGGFLQMLASIKITKGGGTLLGTLGSSSGAATMSNVGSSLASFFGGLAKVGGVVVLAAGIGGVIAEFGKIAEYVSNLKIGPNLTENLLGIGGVIMTVGTVLGALTGALAIAGPAATVPILLGEAALGGFEALIAGLGGIVGIFASVAEQISEMRISSDFGKKCESIAKGIGGIMLVVGALSGAAGTFALPILIGEGVLLSMGKTLEHLLAMADSMQALADLNMSDARIEQASSRGKTLIEAISSLFMQMKESFDSPTMLGLWFDTGSSKSMKTIVTNMHDVVTNLHEVATTFIGMEEDIDKLEETAVIGPDGRVYPDRLGRITEGITEVIGSIGQIFTNIKKELAKQKYPEGYVGYVSPESWFDLWFDKSSSTSMISIITNMVDVVEQISSFSTTVLDMESTLRQLTSHTGSGTHGGSSSMDRIVTYMGEVVAGIGSMYQGMFDAFNPNGTYGTLGVTSMNAGFIGDIMTNLNLVIGKTQSLAEKFPKLEEALETIQSLRITEKAFTQQKGGEVVTKSQSDKKSIMATVNEQLQVFASDMYDMFQTLNGLEQFQQNAMNLSTMTQDLSDSMTYLFEAVNAINENQGVLDTLVQDDTFDLGDKINVIIGSLATAFGNLDYGADAFAGMSMSAAAQAIQESMGYLSSVITILSEKKDVVSSMFNENDMFELGNNIGKIITSLRRAFESLTSGDLDFANLPSKVENVSQAINALGGEGGIFAKLKSLEQTVNGFFGEGDTFQLGERLNTVFGSLNSVLTDVDTTKTAMPIAGFQGFAGQIDNLNTSFQNLASQGVEQATGSLEDSATAMDNAKAAAERLKGALQGLMVTYSTTAGSAGSMISSMYAIMSALNAAATSARNLASAINSIPTQKSISVNYSQSGSISSALGRLAARGHFSKGGRVAYRAYGGSIFRPRGTDTVPAMLTPGEYVMRRAVVNAYGSRFFQNLNNLNLAGALTSLTRRAGAYITPRGSGITNNYNRDNHAQVTQHIHTNNTNYALKRANRWVNAL